MEKKIKAYILKDKDKLTFTGKQLKDWKELCINDYKKSEYPVSGFRKGRRKGYLEACEKIINLVKYNYDTEIECISQHKLLLELNRVKREGDMRYKLNESALREINLQLKEGYSKNTIAKNLGVTISTIVYWTNDNFRRRHKNKSRFRRFGVDLEKERTSKDGDEE